MHASNVAKLLDLVVGNVNDRGLLSVIPVIDILVQVFDFLAAFIKLCVGGRLGIVD